MKGVVTGQKIIMFCAMQKKKVSHKLSATLLDVRSTTNSYKEVINMRFTHGRFTNHVYMSAQCPACNIAVRKDFPSGGHHIFLY